jgi:hypothetical protein
LLILVGRQWLNSLPPTKMVHLTKTTLQTMRQKITPKMMMQHSLKSRSAKWKTVEV